MSHGFGIAKQPESWSRRNSLRLFSMEAIPEFGERSLDDNAKSGVDDGMKDRGEFDKFAQRYAQAWSSHDPESIAAFFAENGSLSTPNSAPAIGPAAIAEVARGFIHDLPDLIVTFDKLEPRADRTAFHWTLLGTNTGPGGTGNRVRISGYELWKIDQDGLIAESNGHFDTAEYARQLKEGAS